ncbi:hypothetical protein HAHE_07820 [Haloferula helveola]|uniref:Uncharacterized protein n=2 Tax=Haloferula helveola TaxID=490095 RepID=A0ABM7RC08_9BACT|nr:hypothetical protein HAHE_07820 [Haloferula helveola]
MAGLSSIPQLKAAVGGSSSSSVSAGVPRFIFLRKSNGTFPSELVPVSLSAADRRREENKEALDLDLDRHELPEWMEPIIDHKDDLTLLQGLSAKMCTMGHSTYQSPLAVSRSAERVATITRASVDVELGRMFTSPFEHIELTSAHDQKGVVRGMSSIGPMQPNYAFASPGAAYKNLFAAGLEKTNDDKAEDNLNRFLSGKIASYDNRTLDMIESQKIGNYADSVDTLIERNKLLETMSARIAANVPEIEQRILNDEYTRTEQHFAFADILVSSLRAGLTNVATFTLDDLSTPYDDLVDAVIRLHDVGHNKDMGGVPAIECRKAVRTHHMKVINRIVAQLKASPEGNGTMFDNTMILYLPENGETHHSVGSEVPFMILAGGNVKLSMARRRYIRLPNYNDEGHKTLGNWYTTILNAYGNDIKHYGDFDVALKVDQEGPIRHFLS